MLKTRLGARRTLFCSVWATLGCLLGVAWPALGGSWAGASWPPLGLGVDFDSILEGFYKDFSMILRIFLKSADLQNSCAHAVFRKGRVLKDQQKFEKKRFKNQCKVGVGKTMLKNCSKN